MKRRDFLATASALPLAGALPALAKSEPQEEKLYTEDEVIDLAIKVERNTTKRVIEAGLYGEVSTGDEALKDFEPHSISPDGEELFTLRQVIAISKRAARAGKNKAWKNAIQLGQDVKNGEVDWSYEKYR